MVTLSFLLPAAIAALSVMTPSLTTLCNMVHPEGFEPSTARFVAEYSIQLSYGCKMAVRRGFEPRMQLLTAYSLSRGAPSASRPPHRTPLTSHAVLRIALRRCVAHILLSECGKSNNFSKAWIDCTIHRQSACFNIKKGILSTTKPPSDAAIFAPERTDRAM